MSLLSGILLRLRCSACYFSCEHSHIKGSNHLSDDELRELWRNWRILVQWNIMERTWGCPSERRFSSRPAVMVQLYTCEGSVGRQIQPGTKIPYVLSFNRQCAKLLTRWLCLPHDVGHKERKGHLPWDDLSIWVSCKGRVPCTLRIQNSWNFPRRHSYD